MTTATSSTLWLMLAHAALLDGGVFHPFFWFIADKGHLETVSPVILGLEGPEGTTANDRNIELLVDLQMTDLVHHLLDGDIKITRVLVMVGIK